MVKLSDEHCLTIVDNHTSSENVRSLPLDAIATM